MRNLFVLCCFTTFFLAAAPGSSSISNSVEVCDESLRIFSIKGHRHDGGLLVKGVILYTNHAKSAKDELPDETRAFFVEKVPHLISEYNIFSSSIFETPYHSPIDFIREGFIDPTFCLTDNTDNVDFSKYTKLFESLFPGEYEGKPVWSMLHIGRLVSVYYEHFQTGFYNGQHETIEDAGVDTWLMHTWKDRGGFLHALEDELDRDKAHQLDPDENFLGWRDTKINEANLKFWKRLLDLIKAEEEQPAYKKYKTKILKFFKEGEMTFRKPCLIRDADFYKFVYEKQTLKYETIRPTGYSTDPVMIYRNSLWLSRLDTQILPKINDALFILAAGWGHQFVRNDESSEKLGIHDYFQVNFESGCLRPMTATEIPKQ
jgi:hypothetical protein